MFLNEYLFPFPFSVFLIIDLNFEKLTCFLVFRPGLMQ